MQAAGMSMGLVAGKEEVGMHLKTKTGFNG